MHRQPRRQGTGPKVYVHAAGSWLRECTNQTAGWAASIKNFATGETSRIFGGIPYAPGVSNIRAEMIAVVEALESLPDDNCTVTLWVPSDFMPKAIRYEYRRNANLDVWERLDKQLARHVVKRFHHSPLYLRRKELVVVHELAREAAKVAQSGKETSTHA